MRLLPSVFLAAAIMMFVGVSGAAADWVWVCKWVQFPIKQYCYMAWVVDKSYQYGQSPYVQQQNQQFRNQIQQQSIQQYRGNWPCAVIRHPVPGVC